MKLPCPAASFWFIQLLNRTANQRFHELESPFLPVLAGLIPLSGGSKVQSFTSSLRASAITSAIETGPRSVILSSQSLYKAVATVVCSPKTLYSLADVTLLPDQPVSTYIDSYMAACNLTSLQLKGLLNPAQLHSTDAS